MRGPEQKMVDAVRRRKNAYFNNTYVVKHPFNERGMLIYLYQTLLGAVLEGQFIEVPGGIPAHLRSRLTSRRLNALRTAFPKRENS